MLCWHLLGWSIACLKTAPQGCCNKCYCKTSLMSPAVTTSELIPCSICTVLATTILLRCYINNITVLTYIYGVASKHFTYYTTGSVWMLIIIIKKYRCLYSHFLSIQSLSLANVLHCLPMSSFKPVKAHPHTCMSL